MSPPKITTQQAAELLGVTPSTIKRWADEGRIPFTKTRGGHRRFERKELTSGRPGLRDSDPGLPAIPSLSLVPQLLQGSGSSWVIGELVRRRGAMGSWARVADSLAETLRELGELWHRGKISISAEHRASETLTRALTWVSESLIIRDPRRPRAVLVTPEGEDHLFGLRLAELVLREARWQVTWLGGNIPTPELIRQLSESPPQLVAVSATRARQTRESLGQWLSQITPTLEAFSIEIVLGGSGDWPEHPRALRLESFPRFHEELLDRWSAS